MDHVLHMSYMTGDIFGITAAMALDDGFKVVFAYNDETESAYKQNKTFYEACGLWDRLEKYDIKEIDSKATPKSVYQGFKGYATSAAADDIRNKYGQNGNRITEIEDVTRRVADKYKANPEESLKKVMSTWQLTKLSSSETQAQLKDYMSNYVDDDKSQCVVIWSRQSGKNGGAHVELDSGFKAIKELATAVNTNVGQRQVLLVGDDRTISEVQEDPTRVVETSKLRRIADSTQGVKAMGSFWKDDKFKDIWGGDPLMERLGQMLLWKDLADRKKVVHVGMRSGNLETFALLGMKTVYLEVFDSPTGERMLQFADAGISYDRFQIDRSLTRTGQKADQLSRNGDVGITGGYIRDKVDNLARPEFKTRANINKRTANKIFDGSIPSSISDQSERKRLEQLVATTKADMREGFKQRPDAWGIDQSEKGFTYDDLWCIKVLVEQRLNSNT
jgi:hypothetical protein